MQLRPIILFLLLLATLHAISQRPLLREFRSQKIEEKAAPSEPDYSNLYFWAAHPLKKDMADSIPSFLKSEKSFPALRIRKVRAMDAGESTRLSLKNELNTIKNNPAT